MSRVVVLGGCGAVGSVAVKTLAMQPAFTQVVIGDVNEARAREIVEQVGNGKVSFVRVDAGSSESVTRSIADADYVLNCVGPFYKTVKTVLGAVIASKKQYVDICDDVDVTLEILGLDAEAKRAGITAVIGMGASPGATNLIAKYLVDSQLDEVDSIDIYHCHGGEPTEGPGVIGHRFHCMSIDIPMFLDGQLTHVKYFEPDGVALRETFDFPNLGPTPVFPYPHPEQVTLPRYIQTKRVTNKGSVIPIAYYTLTSELCRLGLSSREPLDVAGQQVVPYDFAVAYLIRERERLLREADFGSQRGCQTVVVKGRKAGEPIDARVHMFSGQSALGEGTGVPAAIGVMLLAAGKVTTKGVLPPEACIDPSQFLELAMQVLMARAGGSADKKEASIVFETRKADGSVSKFEL